jgi:hypothetical protein
LPKDSDIHGRKFVAGMWKGARGRFEVVSACRQWCLERRKQPLQERQQRSKQHTHFDSIRSVAEKLLNKNIPYLGFKASVQPKNWSATVGPGLQSADFAHGGIELTALVGGE